MDEKKSKNKKVIVIVAIVIAVIAVIGVIGFTFVNDFAQRAIIGSEMEKINTSGEIDKDIKSSGKYADVEKALKDYVVEYQGVAVSIADQYKNEKLTTILSADNYKKDGPEFKESKKLIEDVKNQGEEAKTKLAEMVTDEYKDKRADEAGLTGKYKDLFKTSIQLEGELTDVNKTIDNVNNYLSKIDDVFDFLKENKSNWEIKFFNYYGKYSSFKIKIIKLCLQKVHLKGVLFSYCKNNKVLEYLSLILPSIYMHYLTCYI